MTRVTLLPDSLFDGHAIREGIAVTVERGRIVEVAEAGSRAGAVRLEGLLAPGFIDVQVNGGGGRLLNDDPSAETCGVIAAAHRRFGTTALLPTLITDAPGKMALAMEAMRTAIAAGVPGVVGLHLEGPFLNPARKGIHDPAFMRAPDEQDLAILTAPATGGVVHVTLAPERVASGAIARLAQAGVVVSAGHTEADADRLDAARAEGLRGYTHLFNAMPPLAGRVPGPVGAALSERDTFCGLIADLHHVAPHALNAAIAAKGIGRSMLVTDAMSTVGSDLDGFTLYGRRVARAGGRLAAEDGTLAGSDLDMASAVRNAVTALGLPLADALRMTTSTPAAFLRMEGEIGAIRPGLRADFVLLNEGLEAVATWIAGEEAWA